MIEFFSTQCPHCTEFAPVLETISGRRPDIKFARINGPLESNLKQMYNVHYYPYLIEFGRNKYIEPRVYEGELQEGAVLQWLAN